MRKFLEYLEPWPFILEPIFDSTVDWYRELTWNKIKTFLISLFFWLRVVVYYSSAFYIAYLYFTTHDSLVTVPMCLIFISFLMADKLLIKL